jgi:N-methylhydantoinase B
MLDVERGYVSIPAAAAQYGVVVEDGAIVTSATEARRAAMRATQSGSHFDFGPERLAFERLWTRENYDALTEILAVLPVHWRFFVKTKLFERLPDCARRANENPVRSAYAALVEAYPQITAGGAGRQAAERRNARSAP